MLLLGVGSVLLILGAIGVPVGLGMDSGKAEAASAPTPSGPVPDWQQPPKKVGTNTVTLPVEENIFGASGEIAGHITITVTQVKCGVEEIVNREGLGWQWRPSNGQFCLVHLKAKCASPQDDDLGTCRLPLGLQTAVTSSGENVRVFSEDEGRPLRFLNDDVEAMRRATMELEIPPSEFTPANASVVIPYDVPQQESISGLILYTGHFSRPVEVTVAR